MKNPLFIGFFSLDFTMDAVAPAPDVGGRWMAGSGGTQADGLWRGAASGGRRPAGSGGARRVVGAGRLVQARALVDEQYRADASPL